jgi:hypothetical protein
MTRDGVHRSPQVDVLSVCGCGGSRTRTAACQELAKTGANRLDRATQAGHADFADLGLRDAVEHLFTLSRSLGVKLSPGSRVPRVRACCDSSYRSVDASPNCELGAQPIPARLATDLDTEHGGTDAN